MSDALFGIVAGLSIGLAMVAGMWFENLLRHRREEPLRLRIVALVASVEACADELRAHYRTERGGMMALSIAQSLENAAKRAKQ